MKFNSIIKEIKGFPKVFWLVLLGTFLNQAGNMAFVFLMPYLSIHLGYTIIQASFAFAAFGFSTLVSSVLIGPFIDRYGAARILILALIINFMLLGTFPFIKNFYAIIMMTVLWGLNYGLFRPAVKTLVSFLTPVAVHRISFSIYRWVVNLGMSIGPAIGGFLVFYSYSALFFANALSNIIACVVFILSLVRSPWFQFRPALNTKIELSLQWLKRDRRLLLIILGFLPLDMVFFQHESTLSIHLTQNLHFPLSFYGLLFTLNTMIIVIFELPINFVLFKLSARYNLMLGSFFLTAGFVGLLFATTPWHIMLLAATWTLGEMIAFPTATAYVSQIAPEKNRGSYLSLFEASANIGLCLGPMLGSAIMFHYSANILWIACGALGIMAIIIFSFIPKENGE